MDSRIKHQLDEIKGLSKNLKPGESVMVAAENYEAHVKYLQTKVETQQRLATDWELKYYRLLYGKEGNSK